VVNVQVYNGLYLTATNGGGSELVWPPNAPRRALKRFSLIKLSGSGTVTNGNQVAIRTSGGKYITVKPDGSVDASGTSIGTAQTFTIQMAPDSMPVTPVAAAPTGLVATADQQPDQSVLERHARSHELPPQARVHQCGPYATIAANVSATTNYSDRSPSAGTTYYYVVSAVNSGGESSNSAPPLR
jgi:hypothetical protein